MHNSPTIIVRLPLKMKRLMLLRVVLFHLFYIHVTTAIGQNDDNRSANNTKEDDFAFGGMVGGNESDEDIIRYKNRACIKTDPSDYIILPSTTNPRVCGKKCKKWPWCKGYEFRHQSNKIRVISSRCIFFKVSPYPEHIKKKSHVCVQYQWRGVQAPSDVPSISPSSDVPSISPSSDVPSASPSSDGQSASPSSDAPSVFPSSDVPSASPSVDVVGGNWTFLVMADTHAFSKFAWKGLDENKKEEKWLDISRVLTMIRNSYGGELIMLCGDQVSYGRIPLQEFMDILGGNLSPQEVIYKATLNSHSTTRGLFGDVGYGTVLATIGDHELGGDRGFERIGKSKSKVLTLPSHRKGFGDGMNRNEDGEFLFDQSFGDVASRPLGTTYENTTFAYIHRNALFITVDAFELVGNGTKNYIDRENGLGGWGAVACTVSGDHLAWFESILDYGKRSLDINHIFVQAHLPIIQPVQKVDSTGQFFDRAEKSDFWNLMNEYGVDIYFAGDVHANTATRSNQGGSNLIQVVSRGVGFNNFLTVDVTEDIINVNIYNEYGDDPNYNGQYNLAGHLQIDKSSEVTEILSSGMLNLLDLKSEVVSFDFEEIHPLGKRQVLGLKDREHLMLTEVEIRGKVCKESMFNQGVFGAQLDAQLSNITLVEGRDERGLAGLFSDESRFGVYGSGPFSGGEIISLGVWIRTIEVSRSMVLVHHANSWGGAVSNTSLIDHFTLTLDHGVPVVNVQPTVKLRPLDVMNIANGQWHHIGISMPRKSCMVSELEIYVDGRRLTRTKVNIDRHIFYTTSGRSSLGGFGYSNLGFEDAFPGVGPFIGVMDDFVMFARPLLVKADFPSLKPFMSNAKTSCDKTNPEEYVILDPFNNCFKQCLDKVWCIGYERSWIPDDRCILFNVLPRLGEPQRATACYQARWI